MSAIIPCQAFQSSHSQPHLTSHIVQCDGITQWEIDLHEKSEADIWKCKKWMEDVYNDVWGMKRECVRLGAKLEGVMAWVSDTAAFRDDIALKERLSQALTNIRSTEAMVTERLERMGAIMTHLVEVLDIHFGRTAVIKVED
ncbi:hypothetical protein CC1G_01247 [Coprinopsis cinerea okayama7|uniref:Uncharacterized protein n=1 Tax=Coprinopsis cinerea (strain Okayama-7 / 130 / ATCC MYA-4618 / FGSC 9003) TaxID=240176 RepID=A8NF11_COPC7|nr:hypothetical protein CC1G_01247 [Coprinopsis cinerea okayama7\|eukprot:XP_001833185.1 hypothetical protein CC1G_01247 [Coprinopsis cinerea okayama7\